MKTLSRLNCSLVTTLKSRLNCKLGDTKRSSLHTVLAEDLAKRRLPAHRIQLRFAGAEKCCLLSAKSMA